MDQKAKIFIIVFAVALLGVSLWGAQTLNQKQEIAQERDELKQEAANLQKRADEAEKAFARISANFNALKTDAERLDRERKQYLVDKDKAEKKLADLEQQIKSAKPQAQEVPMTPQAEDAYWAGIVAQKKALELQMTNIQSDLRTAQINNEQLQRENSDIKMDVSTLAREKKDLSRQLDFIKTQIDSNKKLVDSLSLELVAERNDKLKIQEDVKAVRSENVLLKRQMKGLNSRKVALEIKLAEFQDKNKALEARFTETDILLNDKMIQIDKLHKNVAEGRANISPSGRTGATSADSVELSPIVVRPQHESVVGEPATVVGSLLAINRENNFVIIDAGNDKGVKLGDVFRVHNKQDKPIGTIEVVETRKAISACDINKETSPFSIGDTIQ